MKKLLPLLLLFAGTLSAQENWTQERIDNTAKAFTGFKDNISVTVINKSNETQDVTIKVTTIQYTDTEKVKLEKNEAYFKEKAEDSSVLKVEVTANGKKQVVKKPLFDDDYKTVILKTDPQ